MKAIQKALYEQADHCAALGSPFMHALCCTLAKEWPLHPELIDFCDSFSGDIGPKGHSLPLRLAGALHYLVLTGRAPQSLASAYQQAEPNEHKLRAALSECLSLHVKAILAFMELPPQTNEIRRSAAICAAAHWLSHRVAKPIEPSELGASAGLNQFFDRYALCIANHVFGPADSPVQLAPNWDGDLPPQNKVTICGRSGVDLHPIDVTQEADATRLLAYLWPDQRERLENTRKAIEIGQAQITQGDAIDWLETRLQENFKGRCHLIFHSIAWQYFPPKQQTRGAQLIRNAGLQAGSEYVTAWLAIEADAQPQGAAITLTLFQDGVAENWALGRMDFHGRWIKWHPQRFC